MPAVMTAPTPTIGNRVMVTCHGYFDDTLGFGVQGGRFADLPADVRH
jgi:hypothetical protein